MQTDGSLTFEIVDGGDRATVERLIEIGNESTRTLGLLRPPAYHEAARRGCLLAARVGDDLAGYALFGLPRDKVRLTHLCVLRKFRRGHIGTALVEEISRLHQARLGIVASCRDDYDNIYDIWRSLGFRASGTKRGRGFDQAPMTIWWRDHGHSHLFTPDEPVLDVAVDLNILIDFQSPAGSARFKRSEDLLSSELADRIEVIVTPGVEREISGKTSAERRQIIAASSTHRRVCGSAGRADAIHGLLEAEVRRRDQSFPRTSQDEGDLWQVAEAAAAGITVFLTWDNRLADVISPAALVLTGCPELTRLRIISPDHLVIHLDELAQAASYQQSAVAGSDYSIERVKADSERDQMSFIDQGAGERKNAFRSLLRQLVRDKFAGYFVRSPEGDPVAFYSYATEGRVLEVRLLRVASTALADTFARYLLWSLRKVAREAGSSVVKIVDTNVSPTIARAASHESYQRIGEIWYGWVIDAQGPGDRVAAAVNDAYALVEARTAPLLVPDLSPEAAAQYERTWWPAKIADSRLRHFIIPIQPRWSTDLLGIPQTLVPRPGLLALGREQVYYRSGHPSTLDAPGRVLWYLSSDASGPGRLVGTSLLDAVDAGSPEEMYSTYSHYGIFGLDDVRGAASRKGKVQVLRLSDTEIFKRSVSWSTYAKLRGPTDPKGKSVQGPANISSSTFQEVYNIAMSAD